MLRINQRQQLFLRMLAFRVNVSCRPEGVMLCTSSTMSPIVVLRCPLCRGLFPQIGRTQPIGVFWPISTTVREMTCSWFCTKSSYDTKVSCMAEAVQCCSVSDAAQLLAEREAHVCSCGTRHENFSKNLGLPQSQPLLFAVKI